MVVELETKKMYSGGLSWVEYQKQQFSIRINQPNYWCKAFNDSLHKMDSLGKNVSFPFKKQSQIQIVFLDKQKP